MIISIIVAILAIVLLFVSTLCYFSFVCTKNNKQLIACVIGFILTFILVGILMRTPKTKKTIEIHIHPKAQVEYALRNC